MSYKEWRNVAGELHREDGPAQISRFPDGSIYSEFFYVDGVFHRKDGPAHTCHNLDGSIHRESFCIAGDFLGYGKEGFWALWEMLTEVERQAPALLKYLAKFS